MISEDSVDEESLQDNLDRALTSSLNDPDCISTVRCAAHTLQLAVRDACIDNETQDLIKTVRNLVKKLRTQNYAMFLRASGMKKPLLDCPTRWGSTFDMLERFFALKEVISEEPNNDLFFPVHKWPILVDVIKSLKPSKVLTLKLQTEQLTLGDFYGEWLRCELETEGINTHLSSRLVQKMKERQKLLFENKAFLSAVYLDPRFNSTLTPEQQTSARDHLLKTYHRMVLLENDLRSYSCFEEVTDSQSAAENTGVEDVTANETNLIQNKLRDFIATRYIETHQTSSASTRTTSQTEKLKDF